MQETILKEYKTEHNKFIERINNTPIIELNLIEYLKRSIESHKDKFNLCVGWDYLKQNLTKELKEILLNQEYQDIVYNSQNEDFILNSLNLKEIISQDLIKQLGSFVYVWKDIKRKCDEQEKEQNLKESLEKQGFKKIELIILNETKEQYTERLKQYDGKRVLCVLDISCIGVLGSFDKKEEKEGKLTFSDYHNTLMLIPKRSRTKGFIIKNDFYIKDV